MSCDGNCGQFAISTTVRAEAVRHSIASPRYLEATPFDAELLIALFQELTGLGGCPVKEDV